MSEKRAREDDFSDLAQLYQWRESLPTDLDERTFPKATYRSRGQEVKTAVHWGQRKLQVSEMQLLTYHCEVNVGYWIVYVGSAPGSHLLFLDKLFGGIHSWELIDPGKWDHRLVMDVRDNPKSSFCLRNEFFDNAAAYDLVFQRLCRAKCSALALVYRFELQSGYSPNHEVQCKKVTDGSDAEAARTDDIPIKYEKPIELKTIALSLFLRVASERCKMLFISDVRSGSEASEPGVFERHVFENTQAQEAWVDIINPTFAMLKFRLPYSFIKKYSHDLKRNVMVSSGLPSTSLHPDGTVLLPVWTRPTSTECRLVVPQYCKKRSYDHQEFEDAMFFFNSVVRERVHFAHSVHNHAWINHHYDGASEVALLGRFFADRDASLTPSQIAVKVLELSEQITAAIGGSFERAVGNRDAIHIGKGTRGGWLNETREKLKAATDKRSQSIWRRNLFDIETMGSEPLASCKALHIITPCQEDPLR